MAALNFFQGFFGYLGLGALNLNTDTLMAYLTNNAPSAADDDVLADLAGITEQNGYAAADVQNAFSEAAGVGTLTGTDIVWTGSGDFGPFRYAVVYDDTHANNVLCFWWDYGSAITVHDGETMTLDFGASILTIAAAA